MDNTEQSNFIDHKNEQKEKLNAYCQMISTFIAKIGSLS